MNKRTKNIILIIVVLQIVLIVGLLALPTAVQAIPGRYRVALSERSPVLSNITEGVINAVAPVATALPAPSQDNVGDKVDIGALIVAEAVTMEPAVTSPIAAIGTGSPTKSFFSSVVARRLKRASRYDEAII